MKYALLIYNALAVGGTPPPRGPEIDAPIRVLLERPQVVGWQRLMDPESATTVKTDGAKTLLVDGPFVDSKEYIGGVIIIEADNLDGALAFAAEVQEARHVGAGGIEVRPVSELA
jgi:hypothetical protein